MNSSLEGGRPGSLLGTLADLRDSGVIASFASWQERDTSAGAVERALADLRRREVRVAVRTAVLTLVVPTYDDAEAAEALEVVREMGGSHPSRTIVLLLADDGAHRLDADVTVHVLERDGRAVCVEDIVLRVRGTAARHLDSLVEPFTLPDVPVAVWCPRRLPRLDDPALVPADRVVVDGRQADTGEGLADLAALVGRLPVADLSWVRLTPWRELMAGLFEGREFRPFLRGVRTVRVAGKYGPRHLLGGWLASRLELPRATVHLSPDEHASMEIVSEYEGRRGRFVVQRPTDERVVHASAEITGGPSHDRLLRLRDRSASRVLGLALAHMGADPVYEAALHAAAEISP